MNKLGVCLLSCLATLGVSAGSVAIMSVAPATKDLLNVSWDKTQLVGGNLTTINKSEEKINELEKLRLENEKKIVDLTLENTNLANQILGLDTELEDYEERVEELNRQKTLNESQILLLRNDNEKYEKQIKELLASNESLTTEVKYLVDENGQLKEDVGDLEYRLDVALNPYETKVVEFAEDFDIKNFTMTTSGNYVFITSTSSNDGKGVWVLDKTTCEMTKLISDGYYLNYASNIGDDLYLISCQYSNYGKGCYVVNIKTKEHYKLSETGYSWYKSTAITGKTLLMSNGSSEIYEFNIETGEITPFEVDGLKTNYKIELPDGNILYSGTSGNNGLVHYNIETGKFTKITDQYYSWTYCYSISDEEVLIGSNYTDCKGIFKFNLKTLVIELVVEDRNGPSQAMLTDHGLILWGKNSSSNNGFAFLNLETYEITQLTTSGWGFTCTKLSDTKYLMQDSTSSSAVYLLDVENLSCKTLGSYRVCGVTDNLLLLGITYSSEYEGILLYNIEEETTTQIHDVGTYWGFRDLGGGYILCVNSNTDCGIYDVHKGTFTIIENCRGIGEFTYKVDDNKLLVGSSNVASNDSGLYLLNREDGTFTQIYDKGYYWRAFYKLPNGDIMVTSGYEHGVLIYRPSDDSVEKVWNTTMYLNDGYQEIGDNTLLFYGYATTNNGLYTFNYETREMKLIMANSSSWTVTQLDNGTFKCVPYNQSYYFIYNPADESMRCYYSFSVRRVIS